MKDVVFEEITEFEEFKKPTVNKAACVSCHCIEDKFIGRRFQIPVIFKGPIDVTISRNLAYTFTLLTFFWFASD